MRGDLPLPGSTRARLLDAGLRLFREHPYDVVEVHALAAEAGVTIGALYHHFGSKQGIYGVLRDEMTRRATDRIEAAADVAPPQQRLHAALVAAYQGVFRIGAGRLLTDTDPRVHPDALGATLAQVARQDGFGEPEIIGQLLAALLRAALQAGQVSGEVQARVQAVLDTLTIQRPPEAG